MYSNKFTFQYGATSTEGDTTAKEAISNIYIPIWSYFYAGIVGAGTALGKNLHSNMELLLPPKQITRALKNAKFTFQYGATSTKRRKCMI